MSSPAAHPNLLDLTQETAVRGSQPTTFFEDEWRNPVYVQDFVRLVGGLLDGAVQLPYQEGPAAAVAVAAAAGAAAAEGAAATGSSGGQEGPGAGGGAAVGGGGRTREGCCVFNFGGPERMSRVDMARRVRGLS